MRHALLILAVAVISTPAQQAPPPTEVYLMALPLEPNERGKPLKWINISNSPGYDNQPSFLPDSSALLFSSNRDGKQTDIYRYDIAGKALKQVTNTPEAEYSPTMTPDGKTFSVIRVEADGAQRLWSFDLASGANPRLVLENVKPIGYHAWIDATHLALFILGAGQGAPATLQIADTKTGTAEVAATGIGRSVLLRPGAGTVSYITTGATRMVREYDPAKHASRDLFAPLEGSQDAAWGRNGGALWMANGVEVFGHVVDPAASSWRPLFNLVGPSADPNSPKVSGITRMAISPDGRWLAFVAEPAK